MIRRRLQSDTPSAPAIPTIYEKANKANSGIPFVRISLSVLATTFVLFLLMLVDHLDSISSHNQHFEPNKYINSTIADNDDSKNHPKIDQSHTAGAAASNIQATTTNRNSIGEIPYIRYDPLNVDIIKERMDYASSHGDAENPNNSNNTIGQHLLDFGIIGFPKCGTTTMSKFRRIDSNCIESN